MNVRGSADEAIQHAVGNYEALARCCTPGVVALVGLLSNSYMYRA
jgi:hypothetical protein